MTDADLTKNQRVYKEQLKKVHYLKVVVPIHHYNKIFLASAKRKTSCAEVIRKIIRDWAEHEA